MTVKEPKIDQHSVHDVMCSIDSPWQALREWFYWPADLFLLTSFILKKTGAYRRVLLATDWKTDDFLDLDDHCKTWLRAIQKSLVTGERLDLPPALEVLCNDLDKKMHEVKFTELKALSTEASKELSILLIKAHALALMVVGHGTHMMFMAF